MPSKPVTNEVLASQLGGIREFMDFQFKEVIKRQDHTNGSVADAFAKIEETRGLIDTEKGFRKYIIGGFIVLSTLCTTIIVPIGLYYVKSLIDTSVKNTNTVTAVIDYDQLQKVVDKSLSGKEIQITK